MLVRYQSPNHTKQDHLWYSWQLSNLVSEIIFDLVWGGPITQMAFLTIISVTLVVTPPTERRIQQTTKSSDSRTNIQIISPEHPLSMNTDVSTNVDCTYSYLHPPWKYCHNPSPSPKSKDLECLYSAVAQDSWCVNLSQIFTVDLNNQEKLIKVKVRQFD